MRPSTIATTLAMMAALALPASGQMGGMAGGQRNMMGQGMMPMCHAMMGGSGGHAMGGGMEAGSMMSADGAMHAPGGMMSAGAPSGMMGMMGMMRAAGSSPDALLVAGERLQLTDGQKAELERLTASAHEEHQRHMSAAMEAHREATSLLDASAPDMTAYAARLEAAAQHMARAHVARTRASLDARGVLTDDQRVLVEEGMGLVGAMMCGMMVAPATGGAGTSDHAQHHR